jgi:hypothetical protein
MRRVNAAELSARGIQRLRLGCWHGLGRRQSDRANGPPIHNAFREKVTPRGYLKTPSKPPKLLSLIGPRNANASSYLAFLRALGRTFSDPALDALSALPPRADIHSAKWNDCFGPGANISRVLRIQ